MDKIIAIWGKTDIAIAETPDTEEMAADDNLIDIGAIEDKTAVLGYEDGSSQELKSSGGELVDIIEEEGKVYVEATLIEPTSLYAALGLSASTAEEIAAGKIRVNTHIVDKRYSLRLRPKRVGGWGIDAPVTQIKVSPAGEEAKGGSLKLRFTIIKGMAGYLYDRVTKKDKDSKEDKEQSDT